MTQFHEGQEVEVLRRWVNPAQDEWRDAKIVGLQDWPDEKWLVQFPDGARAVFDTEHIRTIREGRDDNGRIVRGY